MALNPSFGRCQEKAYVDFVALGRELALDAVIAVQPGVSRALGRSPHFIKQCLQLEGPPSQRTRAMLIRVQIVEIPLKLARQGRNTTRQQRDLTYTPSEILEVDSKRLVKRESTPLTMGYVGEHGSLVHDNFPSIYMCRK